MKRALGTLLICLGMLLVLMPLAASAQTNFQELEIVSSWGGLGTPAQSVLMIKHQPGGYYVNGEKIDERLITDFLNALDEPKVAKLELSNLGITQEWLNANALTGVKEYASFYYST